MIASYGILLEFTRKIYILLAILFEFSYICGVNCYVSPSRHQFQQQFNSLLVVRNLAEPSLESRESQCPESINLRERRFIRANILHSTIKLAGFFLMPKLAMANDQLKIKRNLRPLVYSIEWTDPPCLQPRTKVGEIGVIQRFSNTDICLLGAHKGSNADALLQLDIVTRLFNSLIGKKRRMSIGLAIVPSTNQNEKALKEFLDNADNVANDEDFSNLLQSLEFLKESDMLEFSIQAPIVRYAKNNRIPLVPLAVSPATLKTVGSVGFEGLSAAERDRSVPDPDGFVQTVSLPAFQRYTKEVIFGPLVITKDLTSSSPPGQPLDSDRIFSEKILRDEVTASTAARYVTDKDREGSGTVLVVLAGSSDVVFGYGLQERMKRNLNFLRGKGKSAVSEERGKGGDSVLSVLLNPITQDSLAFSGNVQLRLALSYGPNELDERPLSDFLWFSSSPAVRLLTRPKNPISNEGDKPPGESSVIGAF